jgi:hypothetical protein
LAGATGQFDPKNPAACMELSGPGNGNFNMKSVKFDRTLIRTGYCRVRSDGTKFADQIFESES